MLSYKVFGNVSDLLLLSVCKDVGTAISAAGTTQGTATQLTNAENFLTTVAAGSGVILDSQASAGDSQFIYNGGANPVNVYPPSGARIQVLATNLPMILPVGTSVNLYCASTTLWAGVLSR